MKQYDNMRKRNAFLDWYKKFKMFSDTLEEFDSCREVVAGLVEEYKASATKNYLEWGEEKGAA